MKRKIKTLLSRLSGVDARSIRFVGKYVYFRASDPAVEYLNGVLAPLSRNVEVAKSLMNAGETYKIDIHIDAISEERISEVLDPEIKAIK